MSALWFLLGTTLCRPDLTGFFNWQRASALFYFSLPSDPLTTPSSAFIHFVDLGLPILDYVVSDHHGRPAIWVSTDSTWNHPSEKDGDAPEANVDSTGALVRLVHWFDGKVSLCPGYIRSQFFWDFSWYNNSGFSATKKSSSKSPPRMRRHCS